MGTAGGWVLRVDGLHRGVLPVLPPVPARPSRQPPSHPAHPSSPRRRRGARPTFTSCLAPAESRRAERTCCRALATAPAVPARPACAAALRLAAAPWPLAAAYHAAFASHTRHRVPPPLPGAQPLLEGWFGGRTLPHTAIEQDAAAVRVQRSAAWFVAGCCAACAALWVHAVKRTPALVPEQAGSPACSPPPAV